ncbi:MAG: type II toxin-antitoxin system death-on-curing family toxin [Planctomycetota bacterium]
MAESSLAQPRISFGGKEPYETLTEKAAALCFALVINHPFIDGNKRVGHAAMETFLLMNGLEFNADVDDSESAMKVSPAARGGADRRARPNGSADGVFSPS